MANEAGEIALPEAAQRLGISWQRAWRLVLTGQLPGRKVGGRWVVNRLDVERAVATQAALSPKD